MKVIPLPFSSDLIKANLCGRKKVTRRPVKIPRGWQIHNGQSARLELREDCGIELLNESDVTETRILLPPWSVNDLIWVKETWGIIDGKVEEVNKHLSESERAKQLVQNMKYGQSTYSGEVIYRSDGDFDWAKVCKMSKSMWKASMLMPRVASRTTLRVTNVRAERLQSITDEQALLEGMPCTQSQVRPRLWFKGIWDEIYNDWDCNPIVWVIEYDVINENVDEVIERMKRTHTNTCV
ncbi:hypothetical protein L1D14_10550 [Vibrio tubiashii]|uniref:hypothetical protein n=1 Tax=Vibrio tubiashii TaxID=29498 RepID=UPI001EFDCA47|nr:hypothetical protein [Vibrio tubiashii]MCG9576677.1 hypothetical protein [Vibrio tubiashii]